MNRRLTFLFLVATLAVFIPLRAPAPFVYVPGEGWSYEPVGGIGKWRKPRAKEQLDVAQEAFDKKDFNLAFKAASHLLKTWPMSDYAAEAQYIAARCREEQGQDEKAFDEYQKMFEKYPKSDKLKDALKRQYQIGIRFLEGQRFKLWGVVPFLPNMTKTAELFGKIVSSGPYSDVAPQAQLRIGAAWERNKEYSSAVAAYELAADRYHNQPIIAADALFRAGMAYTKQAQTAEYDQGTSGQAIATFTDFITLFPDDRRVHEARKIISSLKTEQSRGNFKIAEFYAKQKKWSGALVYYNEVLLSGQDSSYSTIARERIDEIKSRLQPATSVQ